MNLFDLHCDTAGECFNRKLPLLSNELHIDLCKGDILDKWVQVFAVWIPDERRGEDAAEYLGNVLDYFEKEIKRNNQKIKLCKGITDVENAIKTGRCAAITAVEGASPFVTDYGKELVERHSVKLITLTWNAENEFGFGCQSGCDSGLKPSGKGLLNYLRERNIAVDVSHLNRAGFYDAVSSGARIIASHSNSESVLLKTRKESEDKFFSCRRSLNDEQIKLLAEIQGLIGINFCRSFLGDVGDDGFEAAYRHIVHILELGGEDILAIGSDYDGCEINPELSGIDKIPSFGAFLLEKGFDKTLVNKIFFENAMNFFKNILQP